jgi:Ca2+-binding RTX toxin-like protein
MAHIIGTENDDDLPGTNGADVIRGLGGDDDIAGYGGADTLFGGDGDDYVWGADDTDTVYGGAGDDIVVESDGGDTLYGGAGVDTLSLSYLSFFGGGHPAVTFDFVRPAHGTALITPDGNAAYSVERLDATGSNFNDVFKGGVLGDEIEGWSGNDRLFGRGGNDRMFGENGNDKMFGGAGDDLLAGGGNDDTLYGGRGDDTLFGGGGGDLYGGNDALDGGPGADTFSGGFGHTDITYADSKAGVYADLESGFGFGGDAEGDRFLGEMHGKLIGSAFADRLVGADELYGGNGDDELVTGTQTSIMEGGAGKDTFVINYILFQFGSPHITDFDQAIHEVVDVSGIDARQHSPFNDAFRFIGSDAFDGRPGELRYEVDGSETVVQLSVDRDADAEYTFTLDGVSTLAAADFVL